jgi:hypothetical protein
MTTYGKVGDAEDDEWALMGLVECKGSPKFKKCNWGTT